MLRQIGLLHVLAGSIFLLTVSSALAGDSVTVYGSTPFDEKLVQVPEQRVILKPGETELRKLSAPFKTFHVANPDIVDILPLNDTTVSITGKKIGDTDIDILGNRSEPVAKILVSMVVGRPEDLFVKQGEGAKLTFKDKPVAVNIEDRNKENRDVVEVTPGGEHSLFVIGKQVGSTEIVVFGESDSKDAGSNNTTVNINSGGNANNGGSTGGGSGAGGSDKDGGSGHGKEIGRYTVHVTEHGPIGGRPIGVSDGRMYWCSPGFMCESVH